MIFPKDTLTKISAAVLVLAQSPDFLADAFSATKVFAEAVDQPFNIVSLVAAVGVVWGGFRRFFNYFGK